MLPATTEYLINKKGRTTYVTDKHIKRIFFAFQLEFVILSN